MALGIINATRVMHGLETIIWWDFPALSSSQRETTLTQARAALEAAERVRLKPECLVPDEERKGRRRQAEPHPADIRLMDDDGDQSVPPALIVDRLDPVRLGKKLLLRASPFLVRSALSTHHCDRQSSAPGRI
jgi:hypothetical protein